jgi:hypothetical protein
VSRGDPATTYAYDPGTHQLLAVWDTGIGATARTKLNAAVQETVGVRLAQALTRMSEAVWLSYVRPEIFDLPVPPGTPSAAISRPARARR